MCPWKPHNTSSPHAFFQRTITPWNCLGNASLGLLILNSQFILAEMRIRWVKQTRQSHFVHHRTLAKEREKMLETFSESSQIPKLQL